jgi:hypothetical protein
VRKPPAEGVEWSEERGRWELTCHCGRVQGYAASEDSGGITTDEAEHFGWRKIDGAWHCPFCTGNLDNLKRVMFKTWGGENLDAVIHAVLESRDEEGYPDACKAIGALNEKEIPWEPLDLWTACSMIAQRTSRARFRRSERRFNLSTLLVILAVLFVVGSEIARWVAR